MNKEVAHYVVTAQPPGSVLVTAKCNFLSPHSKDVLVAKSRRLEVRQLRTGLFADNNNNNNNNSDHTSSQLQPPPPTAATASPFPVVLQLPINGRITHLVPLRLAHAPTSYVFFLTDRLRYAVISHNPHSHSPYPAATHASGSLRGEDQHVLGRLAESGPLVAVDPHSRCIALHLYDGLLTIIPVITHYTPPPSLAHAAGKSSSSEDAKLAASPRQQQQQQQVLGAPFHCRIEERTVLSITFLYTATPDHHENNSAYHHLPLTLCVLHQGARGEQHVTSMIVNLADRLVHLQGSPSVPAHTPWLHKRMVDGGSSMLIPVPPTTTMAAAAAAGAHRTLPPPTTAAAASSAAPYSLGGVIVVGQQQLTYCSPTVTKILPVPQALFLTADELPADPAGMPRFLLGDEWGRLHMLTVILAVLDNHNHPTSSSSNNNNNNKVVALQRDTLGSCVLSSALAYLEHGLVFVGSSLGDSQLIQIHDEPIPLATNTTCTTTTTTGSAMDTSSHPLDAAATSRTSPVQHIHDSNSSQDGGGGMSENLLMDTTYLSVVEEYTQLGPILDFDLIPTTMGIKAISSHGSVPQQSQVVTASGSSHSGSIRLIRNGIGMNESAAVEIPGIQDMWSVRASWYSREDAYLVQSFVGETRVLGVAASASHNDDDNDMMVDQGDPDDDDDDVDGTLEEVVLPGLDSAASSLHVGNIQPGDRLLQITRTEVRLLAHQTGDVLDIGRPGQITMATANEAGQIVVALTGGTLVYMTVQNDKIETVAQRQMEREVSCIDIHPLIPATTEVVAMETDDHPDNDDDANVDDNDGTSSRRTTAHKSELIAVGLWDDFTVRLLHVNDNDSTSSSLEEALCIHLSTNDTDDEDDNDNDHHDADATADGARRSRNNMMARSLSLVTLDMASSSSGANNSLSSPSGVDMLFVGLGDGTLISFALTKTKGVVSVHSKKEVCLGTQRIDLVPLSTERGGTCVLATGDRPTVVYLAGLGGTSSHQSNPKLCYSTVNLAASTEEEGMDDVSRLPAQQSIAVNVATPFFSPLLFDASSLGSQHYSLCVADDAYLRLGVIDDIQKLHVTTCRLGMAPRRIVHCPDGRFFAVGCIESGIKHFGLDDGETNMGNCIRFMDDTTFDDLERIDMEPFEIILSMVYATLKVNSNTTGDIESSKNANGSEKPFLLVGTAYALPNEDEPTRGRILIYTCQPNEADATSSHRAVRQVTEFSAAGGVYSLSQFYNGMVLCTVNSKTMVCQLIEDAGMMRLEYVGRGHHGNILSLFVKSRAKRTALLGGTDQSLAMDVSDDAVAAAAAKGEENEKDVEQLAIVGDLMRSISLVQYYPEHKSLEEIARDFNGNWTTAIEMLHENVYLGAENWNNLFCLRRNTASSSEEIRCRLDTIGEFHLGEMCNKFMSGSLVMPVSSNNNNSQKSANRSMSNRAGGQASQPRVRSPSPQKKKSELTSPNKTSSSTRTMRRPVVTTGSQTLFGTVDGTLGVILGMDGKTTVFFSCLERAMAKVIRPVGDLDHTLFRAVQAERRVHPAHGFCDGDLVESFLDLDQATMEAVVREMNRDGGWQVGDDELMLGGGGATTTNNTRGGDDKEEDVVSVHERAELTVDEVVAMVEEMTMLH